MAEVVEVIGGLFPLDEIVHQFDRSFWSEDRPSPSRFLDDQGVDGPRRDSLLIVLNRRVRQLLARERQVVERLVEASGSSPVDDPRIEEQIQAIAEPERSGLLRVLLVNHWNHHPDRGSIDALFRRFPNDEATLIRAYQEHLSHQLRLRFWSGSRIDRADLASLASKAPEPFQRRIIEALDRDLLELMTRRAEARNRFEIAIQEQREPRIEDALAGLPEPDRSGLLSALARIELYHNPGARPESYRDRFATEADRALIQAAYQEVRRPHAWRFEKLRTVYRTAISEIDEAIDHDLDRLVLLKQNAPGSVDDRLWREAWITGRLEHPNILPVHGLGLDSSNRPNFAMRSYDGKSLAVVIGEVHDQAREKHKDLAFQDVNRPERALLARLSRVCRTIAYAHEGIARSHQRSEKRLRVIHGDIKPSNIMVSKDFGTDHDFGEVYCIDWGMARLIGSTDASTGFGLRLASLPEIEGVGCTPEYMSPEQAAWVIAGPAQSPDRLPKILEPSDTYNLGATLYEVLVGRPPMIDIKGQSEEDRVPSIARHLTSDDFDGLEVPEGQEVPASLAAICRKATRRDPSLRYLNPSAMADDLDRWLADQPVSAYRDPWTVRLARFGRKHQAAASASVVATIAMLIVTSLALVWSQSARGLERPEPPSTRPEKGALSVSKARLTGAWKLWPEPDPLPSKGIVPTSPRTSRTASRGGKRPGVEASRSSKVL